MWVLVWVEPKRKNTAFLYKPERDFLAEAVRFELTDSFPSPVFKTGALNRSATLPHEAAL